MQTWRIVARSTDTLSPDWRERLAARPGISLRRIGGYAERVLSGALDCMDGHVLPTDALLRLGSRTGAAGAMEILAAQSRAGEPLMPFSFLQSLPAQAVALLARQLAWQGDASFQFHAEWTTLLQLALIEAGAESRPLLFGWVDEPDVSRWWYGVPQAAPGELHWQALSAMTSGICWLRLGADGVESALVGK